VHLVQDPIDARFTERLRLAGLAAASGVSQRTLTRLVGHGATVRAAARATGFEGARMLRRLRARS
jgi:hypothetical protein